MPTLLSGLLPLFSHPLFTAIPNFVFGSFVAGCEELRFRKPSDIFFLAAADKEGFFFPFVDWDSRILCSCVKVQPLSPYPPSVTLSNSVEDFLKIDIHNISFSFQSRLEA